ncbi:hypothetical protein HHI36_012608 [Cryptolaemus montrouzieri]|uniref:Uncharacterized protein n=1 Tax=Cryptolaemus montrouzieri TaxID=559131 RepID=A0ABD2NG55_9CUCU
MSRMVFIKPKDVLFLNSNLKQVTFECLHDLRVPICCKNLLSDFFEEFIAEAHYENRIKELEEAVKRLQDKDVMLQKEVDGKISVEHEQKQLLERLSLEGQILLSQVDT